VKIRRRARETYRHERAVVFQELGTPSAAAIRADVEANKIRAAQLRRRAMRNGGGTNEAQLGVVTGQPVAGGNGLCHYCNQPFPSHTADCPVIS